METELHGEKLRQSITEYIEEYCAKEKSMQPNTLREKRELFNRFFAFMDSSKPYNLENVLVFRLQLYKTWITPNSQADLTRKLRALTRWLYKRKYIADDFSEKIEKPKVPKQRRPYVAPEKVVDIIIAGTTPGEGDNLRNRRIKEETRLALFFLLLTGFRINELIELKVGDLNFYDEPPMCYVHSKGGDVDQFPIPINLILAIKALTKDKKKDQEVFAVTEKTCNLVLARGAVICGIDVHLTNHDLRGIFGTKLTKDGITAQLLQKAMRHESIETTMRYYVMLDQTDTARVINGQKLVVNSMQPKNKIEMYVESIRKLFQDDPAIDAIFDSSEGGFDLHVSIKMNEDLRSPLVIALEAIAGNK